MSKFSIEGEYYEGLAIGVTQGFFRGTKKGLVNEKQEFILPAEYDNIMKFEYGWRVKKDGDWGLCNPEGRPIIKPKYSQIEMLSPGLLYMKKKGLYGLYDLDGKILVPSSYDSISIYEDGGYIVSKDHKFGFYDSAFNLILKPKYSSLKKFSKGCILVTEEEGEKTLFGISNIKGKFLLPIKYRAIGSLHDGLSIIQKGGRFGFINAAAEIVIPIQYDSVENFDNGFTIALEKKIFQKDKLYAINKEGKIIISSEKYDIIGRCPSGIIIKEGENRGLVNVNGEVFIQPTSNKLSISQKCLIVMKHYPLLDEFTLESFGKVKADAEAANAAAEKAAQDKAKAEAAKSGSASSASNAKGVLPGLFSVASNKKVRFSKGNLQFNAAKYEFRFAENQWDYIGEGNIKKSGTYDGWIDLFGYGTSGYMGCPPYKRSTDWEQYPAQDICGTNYDWGKYNPITNGGNKEGLWRTLTKDEWAYLINGRANAVKLRAQACIDGVNGLVILPEDFYEKCQTVPFDSTPNGYSGNNYTKEIWKLMEDAGAVFLPAAGAGSGLNGAGSDGGYWSSTFYYNYYAWSLFFYSDDVSTTYYDRNHGLSVRPVTES